MVPVGGHDLDLLAQSNDSNKMLIEVFNNDYSSVACETFTCGSLSCQNFRLAQIFASRDVSLSLFAVFPFLFWCLTVMAKNVSVALLKNSMKIVGAIEIMMVMVVTNNCFELQLLMSNKATGERGSFSLFNYTAAPTDDGGSRWVCSVPFFGDVRDNF